MEKLKKIASKTTKRTDDKIIYNFTLDTSIVRHNKIIEPHNSTGLMIYVLLGTL
jgi:hypothetical protein